MRICIITDNKKYNSNKFAEEAALSGDEVFFATWKDISLTDKRAKIFLKGKIPLSKFDAVILRSANKSLTPLSIILDYCLNNNIRLLNKDFYLRYQSTNKLRQQLIFQQENIPCLKTFYGESLSYNLVKKELGLPFVAKNANGSLGKKVFKINSKMEFKEFINKSRRKKRLFLFQKFYHTNGDYRIFIIGKDVFGPIKRTAAKGEWRTNIHGAKHERACDKNNLLKTAEEFIKKTGLEFAGVDLLIDKSGKPRVIEINTMAGFKIFDEVYPEVNVAKKTITLLRKKHANKSL